MQGNNCRVVHNNSSYLLHRTHQHNSASNFLVSETIANLPKSYNCNVTLVSRALQHTKQRLCNKQLRIRACTLCAAKRRIKRLAHRTQLQYVVATIASSTNDNNGYRISCAMQRQLRLQANAQHITQQTNDTLSHCSTTSQHTAKLWIDVSVIDNWIWNRSWL